MQDSILYTKDVCKSFSHNGEQNHVLSNINIEIYKGDFTVIMGSSGSGKSTLLYALSGMDKITSGNVFYQDKDISNISEKQVSKLRQEHFGFVFQQMYLVSNLSIYENIVVPGYLNTNISAKETENKAKQLLKTLDLDKVKKYLPSQISGGEQQRTAIARAIIHEPALVFADEPTGALNRRNTEVVLDILTNLNQEGQSILMVTHELYAALRANRILYLEDGKIIGELTLSPYQPTQEKHRETQINAWLSSMKW